MSGRADVPRLPLGLASVDRLTVEHIARVSTGHPTPRSTAATSASRPGSVRNSPRSVSGYPHAASMPAVHGSDSRARSVAGDLASLESRAMDYDQSSAKILKQLYEEREEKRRLLHLMRAAGSDLVEPWNKMELIDNSGVQAGSRARDLAEPALPPRTAPRHDRGRSAHAATTAKKISKDASNGAAPEGQSSAVQSNPSSSQFSFTLPTFEVSLPSFPSVDMSLPSLASVFHSAARKDATEEERLNVLLYQAGQEAVSNTDPASKYWLQKSPVSEINQPSGRRGLDFEEADPEQDALALPSDAAAIEGFEAAIQLERKRCQILSQQLLERDDQLHKLEREREFLVKKCASLSLGVETGGTEPAAPDEAAELKARLDSALAALDHHVQREATLVKEAQQAQEECAQAVEALECARKERDDAIARQVQQQKMLVERAGALQAAVQQEGETAQLRTLVQTLESELAEARRASESACADAHSMRQHADRLRKEQESSARQMEEVVTACKAAERMAADAQAEIDAIRSKGTESRLSAVEEQYSKLANELEATATKLAAAMESETSLKGQLDEAKQKLLNSTKSADERVLAMQREHTDLQEKLKMERSKADKQAWDLEEAQTALRAVHGAICKQAPAAVVGGIGVALGSETVSVKGKQRKVVKITQLATAGPAAKAGMKTGDVLVEVDGRDVTSIDVKQVKEMTKGPPGSPLKLKAQRGGKEYEVVLERSGGTGTSMASISDASSAHGNATGVVGKELTASERGKEGSEAAMALHGEVDKMRASLVTMTEEMGRAREEAKGVEAMKKELASSNGKVAELKDKAASLEAELEEAKRQAKLTTKSGDERVLALENAQKEMEAAMQEHKKMAEKQAWDLEEAQTALRAVHGAICKQAPAAVVGGIGVALGSETVSVKGKQRKVVKITQLATAGPAAKCGKVQVGDWLTELDGKDLTGLTLKQVKEMTKGPPGSPLKLKLRRDGTQFDVILERSGGTGTSNASISDSSSMTSGAAGVASLAGREPTISDLGKESCNAATALYEELDRLRRSLTTASEELSRRSQTHATGVGDASKRGMRRAELTVLSAKNLPNDDKTGACAAFCEFEWRGFKGKTSVKAHSCSPRWEETFAFFFDDVTSLADLLIVVKDWRADGQVCDEKRIGQVLIPAESLQTFLQQDQVAHEEGSFAVLDQHGKEIVGQDNEPCVIDLKMRVLGHGEAHASNVEVPHRTGTAAETEGSKWEVFDKLTADLSAAERQVAEHQLEKEKTARELTESLALLHALVAAVCRDERLLPDAASKVGGVGLALVQKAEGSGSKAVGDKALLDKRSFLKIGAIAAGGPADIDRGLGVGDRVLAVDDQDVSALDAKAVGLLLKGPVGTSVKIKALKDDTRDARPYEVSLRREELHSDGADFAEANTPRRLDFAAVEIGKRGCQVAASMHTELDQLRARLSSAESALAEAKEELNQKSMEAAAAASTADSSHKDSAALESATALAKKLSDALKSEKTAVSALEKDKLMLSQELTRAQVELQQLQQDLDVQRRDAAAAALAGAAAADEGAACIAELKLEAQAAEDKIKAVLLQKEEVDSELQDCRRKQADQALDLEEATMAVKAMHSIICKQGPAAAQGGIGVALGSEMVRVKGSPIKMYKVAQLASSGPAAASGAIQAGDYILEVDGRKLAGMHSKDVKLLIRGPSGTSITLKAQRPGAGSGPYHVTLTRGGGEADQSLASMSETASSVGGSTMGASGRLVGREPSVGERMKEGSDAAARLHEELERLRAGGGASAQAANKYAREAADLANELSKARSRLAESEARADVLERKVQQSVAALEESAALLEKREHSDAETLNKVLADNQALQRALLLVDDQAAATGALALLHTGANTPGTADTPALATEGGGTSAASVDGKSTTGDDDARSTSASVYSAVSGKTPELCGVGMRVTNVAPHRVVSFLPNGPVGKSGAVEVGDLLVAVNGVETQAKEIKEVRRLMTGTQGSEVELRFVGLRDGNKETFAVTVIRQPPPKTTRSPIFHAVQLHALRLLPGMSP